MVTKQKYIMCESALFITSLVSFTLLSVKQKVVRTNFTQSQAMKTASGEVIASKFHFAS